MLDALLHEPAVRRSSCRLLEGASEMGDRQAALGSEVSQSDFATQTLIQNLGSAAHLPRCQTAADQAKVGAHRVNLRVLGGDTEHLGNLLVGTAHLDGGSRVHSDAGVAAYGQGNPERDEFGHLGSEQAGYSAAAESAAELHSIGADRADGRRGWGSAHRM